MTRPLRSPDVALPANTLDPDVRRLVVTWFIGTCYFAEVIALPILEALASLFAIFGGAFFTGNAMLLVLLLGQPIRLNVDVNRWWRSHVWVSQALLGVVALLLVIAWLPPLRRRFPEPDYSDHIVETFNFEIGVAGWLLLLFALLHYPRHAKRVGEVSKANRVTTPNKKP